MIKWRGRNQKGQGTVEYVLLLVVVIAIAGAVLTRFFKPFDSWAKNYLGAYFLCLLDTGELPSLGGQGSTGECNANFEAFSLAGGRAEKEGEGKSGSSEESAGAKNRKRDRDSGGGGGNIVSDSRNRKSGIDLQPRRRGTDGTIGSTSVSTIPNEGGGGGYMKFRKPTIIYVNRKSEQLRGLAGLINAERDRAKKREEKVTFSVKESEEGGSSRTRKRMMASAVIKSKAANEDLSGYNFSFSEMLRWVFIIAIVGMLIFLVASQLNSISKGMEK